MFSLRTDIILVAMEIATAIAKAAQILDEERVRPTVTYEATLMDGEAQLMPSSGAWAVVAAFGQVGRAQVLSSERRQRPRPVHETADGFKFKSRNYELLLALFSQVEADDRSPFVASLLSRVSHPSSLFAVRSSQSRFPSWNSYSSELPLVAEFCLRIGSKEELFRAISQASLTPGLIVLLMQIEETVALNFTLFSDTELEHLTTTLQHLRTAAHRRTSRFMRQRGTGRRLANLDYNSSLAPVAAEVVAVCDGIISECKQARYLYLKGALQQNANLEINHDQTRVEDYLRTLGFSDPLLQALNAAERDYRASATPFELKTSLSHLRSFLEGLHEQACQVLARESGLMVGKNWGKSTAFLRQCGLLSQQEEAFATSLYTLISDEGVHPLTAQPEYARLLRNMVIEYGLLFLAKLQKAGIKLP